MTTDLMHDAFVCVDTTTATLLLRSWDWSYSTTAGPPRTTPLRCMSWDRYQRLRIEYEAWRASIVQQNIEMAKKTAEDMRSLHMLQQIKHSEKEGGLSPHSATPGQKHLPVSNHVDYPLHTIVALRISPEAAPNPNTLKAHFAAMSVNAIDYVDVRPELSVALYTVCSIKRGFDASRKTWCTIIHSVRRGPGRILGASSTTSAKRSEQTQLKIYLCQLKAQP